jgi:leucyl aminopeptidase
MAEAIRVDFQPFGRPKGGDAIVFAGDDGKLSERVAQELGREAADLVARAAKLERFKGKPQTALTVPAPDASKLDRIVVVGVGGEKDRPKHDWRMLGGFLAGKAAGRTATVLVEVPGLEAGPEAVAEMVVGARLRAYKFDRYKTKKKPNGEEPDAPTRLTLAVQDPAAARKAARAADGLAAGVVIARDLVNEPPNVLDPEEFARRAQGLEKLGVEVEVLDEKALRKLNMRALLGVGQGSAKESRVVIMRWNGGKENAAPVAFLGKGVVFDTGGISIKPSAGMEDMKGDMAGAACVVGLMHALAARKARANVVGVIGLVENMPDGAAQRPGDIVTSMSGQTIEIINTDAEGRLVLADLLWHVQERFKPRFMIDLATLTGAILVALAQEYAGLFSNNDELAERLIAAGQATGERVWRMPLGPEFDKMIDSKFADMKNTGGRNGGSITAAQLLQRFVNDVPWAHLDIAGTGMNAPQSEINKSWGSGWGVRLLDRLVRDHYEG